MSRIKITKDLTYEEFEKQFTIKGKPSCYIPNNNPYPLCKGNGSILCPDCNLYEDMDESKFYKD